MQQSKRLIHVLLKVIRRFINRSWRWMSAYRMGLTGNAAQWAVRKQKGHRSVSRSAMMHLDAVLTYFFTNFNLFFFFFFPSKTWDF